MPQPKRNRPDKDGAHRLAFERNKKKILATQTVCGICGKPVDKSLQFPHPLSPCIDHIVPVAKGGHPSDIENLQLAHWTCNRQKSDKLLRLCVDIGSEKRQVVSGIAKSYKPEELVGRKLILVSNLKPAVLRGVESNGMILASGSDEIKVVFIDPSVPNGTPVC